MKIKTDIYYPSLKRVVGEELLKLNGSTCKECLQDLIRRYPEANSLIFDDQGHLLRNLFVYANEESLRQPDLETHMKDGDTLIIAALITGG